MYKRFGKRLIDTLLSLIALIILSPLLLITALAVKLSEKFDNLNYFINRVYKYNSIGRLETEEESN